MGENGIRSLIYGKYKSASEFARYIGWSKQKLSDIINKKREPRLSEIHELARALKLPVSEVAAFFLH